MQYLGLCRFAGKSQELGKGVIVSCVAGRGLEFKLRLQELRDFVSEEFY